MHQEVSGNRLRNYSVAVVGGSLNRPRERINTKGRILDVVPISRVPSGRLVRSLSEGCLELFPLRTRTIPRNNLGQVVALDRQRPVKLWGSRPPVAKFHNETKWAKRLGVF